MSYVKQSPKIMNIFECRQEKKTYTFLFTKVLFFTNLYHKFCYGFVDYSIFLIKYIFEERTLIEKSYFLQKKNDRDM